MTESTVVYNGLFGDSDCDISFGYGTGWTYVTNGWYKLYTTHGA